MSEFSNKVFERHNLDDARYQNAFDALRASVVGDVSKYLDADIKAEESLAGIFRYFGLRAEPPAPNQDEKILNYLERALDSTGIMFREIALTEDWHKDAVGAILAYDAAGNAVSVIPSAKGYSVFDMKTGKMQTVTKDKSKELEGTAFCFYRPLPNEELGVSQLIRYMFQCLDREDYFRIFIAMIATTVLGMFVPIITKFAFGFVVEYAQMSLLISVGVALFSITMAQLILATSKSFVMNRISTKMSFYIEAACMMRLLNLPASYFKDKSVGEIRMQIMTMSTITDQIEQLLFGSTLTSIFSIVYIVQMCTYARALLLPALLIVLFTFVVNILCAFLGRHRAEEVLKASSKTSSLALAFIRGLQKIKLAGAEKRAFAIWTESYARKSAYLYGAPGPSVLAGPLCTAISLFGLLTIYTIAWVVDVTPAEYMAFNSAFGLVSAALSAFTESIVSMVSLGPNLKFVEPLMKSKTEISLSRKRVDSLKGGITVENLAFAYSGQDPVLTGVNLRVQPGEYIGVVGKTGCGKSTFMRLLLGFETPLHGSISYDGNNMEGLDLVSLRRNIGTVLQSGELFDGDIYSNITINAPTMTRDECLEICDMVGLGEDIREMPMGLHTIVGGGLSGGQCQRILIARAIAPRPKILLFDEATSALDNVTQKQVTESLDNLHCTRITIAHRITTIKNCDRIVVFDKGVIAEEGTFDELIAKGGLFYELAMRQMD